VEPAPKAEPAPKVEPAPIPELQPAPAPAPAQESKPAPKKVLLVDDDAVILAVYGYGLTESGFDVVTASDGLDAIDKMQSDRPDLVILDMMMPRLTGVEVLKFIRNHENLATLPVAIFTNAFMDELAQAAIEIGVQQTVIKAECTPNKLVTTAQALLSGTAQTISVPPPQPVPVEVAAPKPVERKREPVDSGTSERARQDFLRNAPVIMAELRDLYQAFRKSPDQAARSSRLEAFYRQVHYVTALSGLACFHPIALLSSAFEALLFELQQAPERITPSSLRTIAMTLDFLGDLFSRVRDSLPDQAPLVGRVLVLDDDSVTNRVALFALQRAHLDGTAVESPTEALEMVKDTQYDLILLDVEMPEMSGFDFCKQLRTLPGYQKTPIIYVTVHTDFENRAKGILSGGTDLIAKPFFPIELAVKAAVHLIKSHIVSSTGDTSPPIPLE
jgi:CheY-like chemotaxis protein